MLKRILTAAGIVTIASSTYGAILADNFNAYTTASLDQSPTSGTWSTSATSFALNANGGLNDSRVVSTGSTNTRYATYKPTGIDLSAGPVMLSAYFKTADAGSGLLELSLVSTNSTANTATRAGMRVNFGTTETLQTLFEGSAGASTNISSVNTTDWYRLNVTIERVNATTLKLSGEVLGSNSSGVTGSSLGSFAPTNVTAGTIAGDNDVYFTMRSSFSGLTDNISVSLVPEPASLGLAGLAGMLIGRRRR